ncbi:Deoxynucleotidyltransferase terminal-interacting protein 2 [Tupaia chinensis]|uniref:Deoxynucleotidyltransferase terminal-interacting protein 2 n=1 Tax=Tupaia chinensis TaxID=246437 RepID=L9LDH0_TUPCH|nr:Deoxynucleotidyltransferase terminal-interacting protein 2 [Tupaia chinensis]
MTEPCTNGETSEAESNCSSVSEPQDPIFRVTRRQILIACTPMSKIKKRLKITPINESHTEEVVSEAESQVSGISRIVPSPEITTITRRSKAKSLTEPSQEPYTEAVSDAKSSCSDSSFSAVAEEEKASESATNEEEKEDEKSEEPSDLARSKDEVSDDEDDLLNNTKSNLLKLTSSNIDPGLSIKQFGGLYINFSADKLQSKKRTLTQIKEKRKNALLQKAIITPDFEKNLLCSTI